MQETDSPATKPWPQYLTAKECARILQVHYVTFLHMLRGKNGPPYVRFKGGRVIRMPADEFFTWINNSQRKR